MMTFRHWLELKHLEAWFLLSCGSFVCMVLIGIGDRIAEYRSRRSSVLQKVNTYYADRQR